MIENLSEGDFNVICDGNCGYQKEYYADNNWGFLLKQMKQDGWKSMNKSGIWLNYCKDCKGGINI